MSKKAIYAVIALVAVGGLYWLFVGRGEAIEVAVAEVAKGDVTASVVNTRAGTVKACRRSGLSPAMGGQMAALPVAEGDRVKAGDMLLELWNDDFKAELKVAEKDVVAARGRAREECVRADVARRDARRLDGLQERGLTSEEEVDRATGEADAREAACEAARDAVAVHQARIDAAQAALDRTRLIAPFDGIVAEINGELGEYVTPSPVGVATLPTVDLIDASCLYISAPIDEVDASLVAEGLPAMISLDAFGDQRFPGHVRRVAPYVLEVEKQARTVEIEAEIDNPEQTNLLPGYSADVEVILDTRSNVLRIPTQSLVKGQYVFVLNESAGILEQREIATGVRNWEYVEVLGGLSSGELVVLSVDREGVADGIAAVRSR
jgi:HlyD family secretion protein